MTQSTEKNITRRNKYHNYGHGTSRAEKKRGEELALLQRAGVITGLRSQVKFTLLPLQKKADGKAERSVTYIADYTYYDSTGNYVVEDVKGFRTPEYVIKRKLMLYIHGITIKEVNA